MYAFFSFLICNKPQRIYFGREVILEEEANNHFTHVAFSFRTLFYLMLFCLKTTTATLLLHNQ